MTILLKRNNQKDANYAVHNFYINEGDIVELIEVRRYPNAGFIPDVGIKTHSGSVYTANLNCFDYVKQS